jgi:SAM-dependent methyltransferase
VGAEVRLFAQTQVGESVTVVSSAEGYRLWSAGYDDDPNPVTALEERMLRSRISIDPGSTVFDLATGTGRWLAYAISHGACGLGFDISEDMLAVAATKKSLRGRLVAADIRQLPVRDQAADLAICSFAMGYIASPQNAFEEMARVAHRVIMSDLHPDALEAGWRRSFRIGRQTYDISHYCHSLRTLNACACAAGMTPEWTMDARLDQRERVIFERAGRADAFAAARQVKAISISAWVRS